MTHIYVSKLGRSVRVELSECGYLATTPEREQEFTLLNVQMAKVEHRRQAYRMARAFLETEGLMLADRNKEADPGQWSHTFRVFVQVFLADVKDQEER